MAAHGRYAIYYLPPQGSALAGFGTDWLGWDMEAGRAVPGAAPALTATPRKYGFHGTLKPPFRLAGDVTFTALDAAATELAATLRPVTLDGLRLARMGRIFVLVPTRASQGLADLAAACVRDLDRFRAPAPEAELARRRARGLSPAQEALLCRWGYPYVMEEFRFHLTLTGAVRDAEQAAVEAQIAAALPDLSGPLEMREIALVGERPGGHFETIRRVPLG